MSLNEEKSEVVSTSEQPEKQIAELEPKKMRFVHLYLTGQYDINKLAQLLELHPNTLHNWLKRTDVREVISAVQSNTNDMVTVQLKSLTLKAAQKLSALMDSPIDGVALQAVKDVLDRSGHKSKQEIKIDKTVRTFEEKMKELVEDTIVDAEWEEVSDEE